MTPVVSKTWNLKAAQFVEDLLDSASSVSIQIVELEHLPPPPIYGKLWIKVSHTSMRESLARRYPNLRTQLRRTWIDVGLALTEEKFAADFGAQAHAAEEVRYPKNLKNTCAGLFCSRSSSLT